MSTQYLKELIEAGHDIQLKYHGKTYWITWSEALGDNLIYFYEANAGDEVGFKDADELIAGSYHNLKIKDVWESLSEEDLDY